MKKLFKPPMTNGLKFSSSFERKKKKRSKNSSALGYEENFTCAKKKSETAMVSDEFVMLQKRLKLRKSPTSLTRLKMKIFSDSEHFWTDVTKHLRKTTNLILKDSDEFLLWEFIIFSVFLHFKIINQIIETCFKAHTNSDWNQNVKRHQYCACYRYTGHRKHFAKIYDEAVLLEWKSESDSYFRPNFKNKKIQFHRKRWTLLHKLIKNSQPSIRIMIAHPEINRWTYEIDYKINGTK